jgi:hypothetical protein
MDLFYRAYQIDAKGETAALRNFMAPNDALACERAGEILAEGKWPGIEVWESARQVHCNGVTRLSAGMPDFPPEKNAAVIWQ